MDKKGYSHEGFFGQMIHYDENGNKVGESQKNFWGGYDHYDAQGNKVGSSNENFWGGMDHYNANGEKTGSSNEGFFGQTVHYDTHGNKVGESSPGFTGGQVHYSTNGSADYSPVYRPSDSSGSDENKPVSVTTGNLTGSNYNSGKKEEFAEITWLDNVIACIGFSGLLLTALGVFMMWDAKDNLVSFAVFLAAVGWIYLRYKWLH